MYATAWTSDPQNDQCLIYWEVTQIPSTHPRKSLIYATYQDFPDLSIHLMNKHLHPSESYTRPIPSWDLQSYDDESSIYITLWATSKINQHIQPTGCNWVSYSLFTKHKKLQTTRTGDKIPEWRFNLLLNSIYFLETNIRDAWNWNAKTT